MTLFNIYKFCLYFTICIFWKLFEFLILPILLLNQPAKIWRKWLTDTRIDNEYSNWKQKTYNYTSRYIWSKIIIQLNSLYKTKVLSSNFLQTPNSFSGGGTLFERPQGGTRKKIARRFWLGVSWRTETESLKFWVSLASLRF